MHRRTRAAYSPARPSGAKWPPPRQPLHLLAGERVGHPRRQQAPHGVGDGALPAYADEAARPTLRGYDVDRILHLTRWVLDRLQ